jgi:hypothetical protein
MNHKSRPSSRDHVHACTNAGQPKHIDGAKCAPFRTSAKQWGSGWRGARGRGGSQRFAHYPRRVHELSVNWKSAEAMPTTAAQTSTLIDGDIPGETLFGFVMCDPSFVLFCVFAGRSIFISIKRSNFQAIRSSRDDPRASKRRVVCRGHCTFGTSSPTNMPPVLTRSARVPAATGGAADVQTS